MKTSTSKSFGAVMGGAAASSINLVGAIGSGTAFAIVDFAHGLGTGYSARRLKTVATNAPRRAIAAPVILLRG